ncbi:hypothetical protein [Arsenicicoccus dermatophilus]|uniref:hypothetical protein n=1 Tax=Arsenicicoccus dermatophilus TaxID=1076331 RepID=UPI0039172C28
MQLLAHRDDDLAVTLDGRELETLLDVCDEIDHLALVDGLGALPQDAADLRRDLREVTVLASQLRPTHVAEREPGILGRRGAPLVAGLREPDGRLTRLVERFSPRLDRSYADLVHRHHAEGAWAVTLQVLICGLAAAGVQLTRVEDESLLVLARTWLGETSYLDALRSCSSRLAPATRTELAARACPPLLTGRVVQHLEDVDGYAHLRLDRASFGQVRRLVTQVAAVVPQEDERFAAHYRAGLAQLSGDLDEIARELDRVPVGRRMGRWLGRG